MTSADPVATVEQRRVVVLLDASRQGRQALDVGMDLAGWHQLPLLAIFVREEGLLRRTACGFTMEFSALTGQGRHVDTMLLETRLRAQEVRLRAMLEQEAVSRQLSCTLSVRTGNVVKETLAEVGPGDLLVLGKCSAPGLLSGRLGGSCRELIRAATLPLLLWEQPVRSSGPVMLSLSGSGSSRGMASWRMQSVLDWFRSTGHHDTVRRLNAGSAEQQLQRAGQYAGGLLVLSRSLATDPGRLAAIRLPVLIWPD